MRRALLLGCAIAAGCRDAPRESAATAFEDPQGNPVVIDSLPVDRIVSTLQSATEWLVLLGAADRLVARTDYDRQPELAHLPSLGGGLEVAPEAVAALHPDVVLGWRIRSSVDLAESLRPFGIPVVAVEAADTAEVYDQLATLGTLVGRSARATELAHELRSELARLREAGCPAGDTPESAFVVLWTDPPMTTGAGSWMTELLGAACLRNVFDDISQPWPPAVSIEAIVARQPRWLITSRGGEPGQRRDELLRRTGWRELEAVQAGRIIELDGDLFARAGPGMADWVRAVVSGRSDEPGIR